MCQYVSVMGRGAAFRVSLVANKIKIKAAQNYAWESIGAVAKDANLHTLIC